MDTLIRVGVLVLDMYPARIYGQYGGIRIGVSIIVEIFLKFRIREGYILDTCGIRRGNFNNCFLIGVALKIINNSFNIYVSERDLHSIWIEGEGWKEND